MYLRHLHLRNFRNYGEQSVAFTAAKTILVGDNAQGKSNLLEAVELLAALRSHRTSRDRDFVRDGETIAQITAQVERDLGPAELSLLLRTSGRRGVVLNGEPLRRHLDFLGSLNLVEFSSLDLDLVRGGPEQRRQWMDSLLVQLEPVYAAILQQYNQVLRQRNALLKTMQKAVMAGKSETAMLRVAEQASTYALGARQAGDGSELSDVARTGLADDVAGALAGHLTGHAVGDLGPGALPLWNQQLAVAGTRVIRRRARMIQRLAPLARDWHGAISGSQEELTVRYAPNVGRVEADGGPMEAGAVGMAGAGWIDDPQQIQQMFLNQLQERAIAEKFQGTTLVGPHRDDVDFAINQTSARQYGSQGQQRTLVLALKLAELRLIEEVIGEPPLLLLDDVLAELDLKRQNQLLEAIQDRFQTLITTTHLGAFDAQWLHSSQIFSVQAGQISVGPAFT
jgi:DNA replication and repair protein RecF